MKKELIIFLFLLISLTVEHKITILNIFSPQCDPITGTTSFIISAATNASLDKENNNYPFSFNIVDDKNVTYFVNCELSKEQPNGTEIDDIYTEDIFTDSSAFDPSIDINTDFNYTDDSSFDIDTDFNGTYDFNSDEVLSDSSYIRRIRLLNEEQNEILNGTCRIENIENNFTFSKEIIKKEGNDNIIEYNDSEINFYTCNNNNGTKDDYEAKLFISFVQINYFRIIERNALFYFYGLITNNLAKNYPIIIEVYLIKDGFQEKVPTKANCYLTKDINGKKKPTQGQFSCSIMSVPERVDSFVFHSSKNIASVPNDKGLLNPVITDERIARGEIYNASSADTSIEKLPSFTPKKIVYDKCKETGTFTLIGDISNKLDDILKFQLPLVGSEKITANCLINDTDKTKDAEIYCETNEKFNQSIKISQNIIMDGKKESLIMEKYEFGERAECANYKIKVVEQKNSNPYPILFRQMCNFKPRDKNNKYSFFFAGLTDKKLPPNHIIKIIVYVFIKSGNEIRKKEKEIDCFLTSQIYPENGQFTQADFNCSGDSEEDIEDIEIISSPNVTGVEDLEDYQKSPQKTDKKINETKNDENENSIGRVFNYSIEIQKTKRVPVFEILSMYQKNCEGKGKIRIKGYFSENIEKKFDFIIPLSYPDSSIKCTAPKINANTLVYIDCKVQKEFRNKQSLIIEPRVIKKKNREVLFLKKYNYPQDLTCSNYNEKFLEISEQKYNAPYTFLQANNFRRKPGKGILFHLFLFRFLRDFIKQIPIKIIIIKKPTTLRHLQDENEEQEESFNCSLRNNTEDLGDYICDSDTITINDEKDIEQFIIDSDDISGLTEDNTNPIKTDEDIALKHLVNLSDPEVFNSTNISIFNTTSIKETNCNETGSFEIKGTIDDDGKNAFKNIDDFDISYINPPDSGALCRYVNEHSDIDCYNKEEFNDEKLTIETQFINGSILLNKTQSEKRMTCAINSLSYLFSDDPSNVVSSDTTNDEETDKPDSPYSSPNITNRYFTNKNSSGGLSGGAITLIVIVITVVLVGVGVLIALLKNGFLCGPKVSPNLSNTNKYPTNLPQNSNSSVEVI